jgi:hypothetical protein
LLALGVGTAAAQDDTLRTLFSAKSLKCQFGPGSFGEWAGPKVAVQQARFDVALHFDSIDAKTGKARMIGNQGATDVAVPVSLSGVTFIEQTGSGNMVFTTVFPEMVPGTDEFYAVTSRHMTLPGGPLPSQYHGKCRVWE